MIDALNVKMHQNIYEIHEHMLINKQWLTLYGRNLVR
jgi:hypothetical protein